MKGNEAGELLFARTQVPSRRHGNLEEEGPQEGTCGAESLASLDTASPPRFGSLAQWRTKEKPSPELNSRPEGTASPFSGEVPRWVAGQLLLLRGQK